MKWRGEAKLGSWWGGNVILKSVRIRYWVYKDMEKCKRETIKLHMQDMAGFRAVKTVSNPTSLSQ